MVISFLSCSFIADLIMIKREGKVKNYEGSREDKALGLCNNHLLYAENKVTLLF